MHIDEKAKKNYKDFILLEDDAPIFLREWWLDAIAGSKNWSAKVIKIDNHAVAMPYTIEKKYGINFISQPKLTPFLGPWIKGYYGNNIVPLGVQKRLFNAIVDQLPKFDRFSQNWHILYSNWLPFYWRGFNQTTKYTYIIEDLSDIESVWSAINKNIQYDIKKAKKDLKIRSDIDINEFIAMQIDFLKTNKLNTVGMEEKIRRIDVACELRRCRKIFIAEDHLGNKLASLYLVWDKNYAYYLMGNRDLSIPNSGAPSLLLWEAIKFSSTVTIKFNFEGSMIESIEKYFRGFGAKQVPYFHISKTNSCKYILLEYIRILLIKLK